MGLIHGNRLSLVSGTGLTESVYFGCCFESRFLGCDAVYWSGGSMDLRSAGVLSQH